MVESVEDNITPMGVRHDMVEAIWEKTKPHLEKALEYGDGEFQIDDVLKFLLDRTMQLWVLCDTDSRDVLIAVCTEIIDYPRSKICRVVLFGGISGMMWQEYLTIIEDWAKEQGCSSIESLARKGMAKKLIKLNYKPVYQVSRKKL